MKRADKPQVRLPSADQVASFLGSRLGLARLGVVATVVLAIGFGAVYYVDAIRDLGAIASENAARNFDDREIAGGNALVVEQAALYEARALIPEDETFQVQTGPRLRGATDLTLDHIEAYARYFLLPRKPASDARWILCYGCELSIYGGRLEVFWRSATSGILVGRLE